MMAIWLILGAIVTFGLSGLPACLLPVRSRAGQICAVALMVAAGAAGLAGAVLSLGSVQPPGLDVAWFLPWGRFSVTVDPLGAFFLILVCVVPTLGSVYGLGYWKQAEHPDNGRRLGLAYGLLAAGMGLVVIARDGALFLLAWELMALAAFFAATAEDEDPEVRRAGWIYLIATHIGTLCLFAMFALWARETGSFALAPAAGLAAESAGAMFVLALVGFGFKAGLMPFHVWLPGAHANAPSHVSAVMSGVMLKMGIYGIIRMSSLLGAGADWWGLILLLAGVLSGIAGLAFALGQQDIKRLLAYSSIENIGIIAMGLGLALLGRSHARADWVLLGLGGALFHVWNHGLFKPLLFLGAGAVIHGTHTRDIEQLGGLAKKMPGTALLFMLGAVAISALPPLNGFVSEWLIYLGLFHSLQPDVPGISLATAGAAAGLSLIGALALATFVKLCSTVFLGNRRTSHGDHAHDPGPAMILPMALLAVACVVLGLLAFLAAPAADLAVRAWLGRADASLSIAALVPLQWLAILGAVLIGLVLVVLLVWRLLPRSRQVSRKVTWDCGYAQPSSRMQYGGSSLGQGLTGLFGFLTRPRREMPVIRGAFPVKARFRQSVPDLVLDRFVLPLSKFIGRHLPRIRILQQGQTQVYILYVLAITVVLLTLAGLRGNP